MFNDREGCNLNSSCAKDALPIGRVSSLLNKMLHPVALNSVALLIVRGSTILSRVAVLFIIASFAMPADFGRVAYAVAAAEVAKVIADFGIDILSIREFAINQDVKIQRYFATSVAVIKLFFGITLYTLFLLFFAVTKGLTAIEFAAGLLIMTSLWSNLSINYFQAKLSLSRVCLPIAINSLATVIIAFALLKIKPSVFFVVAVLPFFEAITSFVLLRYFWQEVGLVIEGLSWSEVNKILRRSSPIAITAICVVLYTRLDVIVLGHYFEPEIVGYYGVAFRLTEPFQFVAAAFAMSIYSHIAVTLTKNDKMRENLIFRYISITLFYGIGICLLLLLFAPTVIRQCLTNYVPAIPILQILSIALVFRVLNSSLTSIIQAHGYFSKITAIAMWNLLLIGAILWICVPRYGAIGAAIALLVGEILNTIIQSYLIKYKITNL